MADGGRRVSTTVVLLSALLGLAARDGDRDPLEPLAALEGSWRVSGTARWAPEMPWGRVLGRSEIRPVLGGGFLEESYELAYPTFVSRVLAFYSWDQFRGRFRLAFLDDGARLLDVYEGAIEAGELVATNLETGTWFPSARGLQPGRFTLRWPEPDLLLATWSMRQEDGTWAPLVELRYEREGSAPVGSPAEPE